MFSFRIGQSIEDFAYDGAPFYENEAMLFKNTDKALIVQWIRVCCAMTLYEHEKDLKRNLRHHSDRIFMGYAWFLHPCWNRNIPWLTNEEIELHLKDLTNSGYLIKSMSTVSNSSEIREFYRPDMCKLNADLRKQKYES